MNTRNSSIHTKKYKQIISAVHMVYRLVNSTYNVHELLLRLTRLLCQFIKASKSTIIILETNKTKARIKAVFNNKINILYDKKKDLVRLSDDESRVMQGYTVFRKGFIGLPLIADDIIGGIFLERTKNEKPFKKFDKDLLSIVVEQSVIAIKNLQLYEEQQKVILGSIEFIGKLLKHHGHVANKRHTPVYFKIIKLLAEKLTVGEETINRLYYASVLRDAGAIDVPYDILSKRSQLTPEEFKVIRNQPAKSVALIKPVEFLKPVLPILLYHHENYDGTGYPSGLKKEQIPLGARIMSVVDAFEAMISERPYKKKMTYEEALKEISHHSGTQFDPKVADAFIMLAHQKKFRKYLSNFH